MKKVFVFFLISLLFTSASCNHKHAPDSLVPPDIIPLETKTNEEAQEENPAITVYDEALQLLKAKNNITQTLEIEISYDNNGKTTKESSLISSRFSGLLGDNLKAEITTVEKVDDISITACKSYENNTVIYTFPSEFTDSFTEIMSQEDFLENNDPYKMISTDCFETSNTDSNDPKILYFYNSPTLESWIPVKNYSIIDANATVYLDAKGCLEHIEYTAIAKRSTVTAEINATIRYKAG